MTDSTEIWKPVPSEPGVLASSWGRILQAPSYAPLPNGGYRTYLPEPTYGLVTKARKGAVHEYRLVMLKRRAGEGGRQKPRKVHQLVCEAFHGAKPFPAAVTLHDDEDGLNNLPGNLSWGTRKRTSACRSTERLCLPEHRLCRATVLARMEDFAPCLLPAKRRPET